MSRRRGRDSFISSGPWLTSQRWRARRWPAMQGRLLIRVREFDHSAIVVWPSYEGNPGREVIAREPHWHHDRRHKDHERVQMWRAFLIDKRRVDSISDTRWLVLDGLVHDRVQPMIRHDFEQSRQQRVTRFEICVVRGWGRWLSANALATYGRPLRSPVTRLLRHARERADGRSGRSTSERPPLPR